MAAYNIHNISGSWISIEIRSPIGSGRRGISFHVAPGEMLDILPYAGSIENCKQIAFITNLVQLNRVRVYCEG
jgi:hypothetical protein